MKFVWDRRFLAVSGGVLLLLAAFFSSAAHRGAGTGQVQAETEAQRETLPEKSVLRENEATASNLPAFLSGETGAYHKPAGWEQEPDGTWYYRKEDGSFAAEEFLQVDGRYYYFDASGRMLTGIIKNDDDWYLASETGAIYFDGWASDGNSWYYAGEDGILRRNRRSPDGYALNEEGVLTFSGSPDNYRYVSRNGRQLILNLTQADKIHDYLKKYGWTETAIAGVLGNFQQESGLDPSLEQYSNGVGYGLGQWSYSRRTALEEYARGRMLPVSNLYLQLDFLMTEPDEKEYVDRYSRTHFQSPAEAAMNWGVNWERYDLSDGSMMNTRIPYAAAYYDWYAGR